MSQPKRERYEGRAASAAYPRKERGPFNSDSRQTVNPSSLTSRLFSNPDLK
ncbi:hypothetical protein N9Z15_05220 [Akkermansiaceae bacterium]|nr:hypothetical protein [Akkermansiaceae bacterium]MDB4532546.1 hypothetical protein [bacterium]